MGDNAWRYAVPEMQVREQGRAILLVPKDVEQKVVINGPVRDLLVSLCHDSERAADALIERVLEEHGG